MLSCSWAGGLPTLTLIPHTDPPTFAAAAQAFAALHYSQHKPAAATATAVLGQHTSRDSYMSNEDFGQPMNRVGATANQIKAVAAEDFGQAVARGSATLEQHSGERISGTKAHPSSIETAQISEAQQPAGSKADPAGRITTSSAADLTVGGHHTSSSANPALSPDQGEQVLPKAAVSSQQLHSNADFSQVLKQYPGLATAPDHPVRYSIIEPVSQMAAGMAAKDGDKLLQTAAAERLDSSGPQGRVLLDRVDHRPRPGPPQTQTQTPPDPHAAHAAAADGLLVFEDR